MVLRAGSTDFEGSGYGVTGDGGPGNRNTKGKATMEPTKQNLAAAMGADAKEGAACDHGDKAARRYLLYLASLFIERADRDEVLDLVTVLRYWVNEQACMLPEDKANVDLVRMAMDAALASRRGAGLSCEAR